jgi:hypothetical protein
MFFYATTGILALCVLASRFYWFHRILTVVIPERYVPYHLAPLECSNNPEYPTVPGQYIVSIMENYGFDKHVAKVGADLWQHVNEHEVYYNVEFPRRLEDVWYYYPTEVGQELLWRIRREAGIEHVTCNSLGKLVWDPYLDS